MAEENPNTRIEAFSDGVVAVAITLLVLDIRLPENVGEFSDTELWTALGAMWPRLMAFLISFAVIGVYWINHRSKFRHIVKSDRALLYINLLFLLFVCIVPFTTSLIAENPGTVGTAIYAGGMVACGLALTWLWLHADRAGLVDAALPRQERQRLLRTTLLSSGIFAVSVPISFAHPDGAKLFWLLLIPSNLMLRAIAAAWVRVRHPNELAPKPPGRSGD